MVEEQDAAPPGREQAGGAVVVDADGFHVPVPRVVPRVGPQPHVPASVAVGSSSVVSLNSRTEVKPLPLPPDAHPPVAANPPGCVVYNFK